MPEVSRFYGLVIKVFFRQKEHEPPHIHVLYGEKTGEIDIATGEMLEGDLPPRALALTREWLDKYRREMQAIWDSQVFRKLPPLQ